MDTDSKDAGIVLRRILNDGGYDIENDTQPPAAAFRPSRHDVDGISISMKSLRTPVQEGESGRNPKGYFVAEVPEQTIIELGLTIKPDPIPENKAHCVIPELCASAKKERKAWLLEVTTALAEKAICVTGPYQGAA